MNKLLDQQVTALSAQLAADRKALRAPGHEALWPEISEDAGAATNRVARAIEREHPDIFGKFGTIEEIYVAIIEVFDTDKPKVVDSAGLADALQSLARKSWLVGTPLTNLAGPQQLEPLGDGIALIHAHSGNEDWGEARRQLKARFGADLQLESRFEHDGEGKLLDTRRSAWLITVEQGSRDSGCHRAMTKARLLLATWTLLSPPEHDLYMSLWPVATEWLPQPHLHVKQRSVGLEDEEESGREQGATVIYTPDEEALYVPPDGELRSAPVRAIDKATTHQPAAQLLAAAWSLYLPADPQTDLLWIDRMVMIQRARDIICEPQSPATDRALARWKALSRNLRIEEHLRGRGFDQRDLAAVTGRSWNLRNAGVHSADGILMSLGFPIDRERVFRNGEVVTGAELGPLHIREGAEAPFAAIHFATVQLWRRMLKVDFDAAAWELLFK